MLLKKNLVVTEENEAKLEKKTNEELIDFFVDFFNHDTFKLKKVE